MALQQRIAIKKHGQQTEAPKEKHKGWWSCFLQGRVKPEDVKGEERQEGKYSQKIKGLRFRFPSLVWWCTLTLPALQEAQAGGLQVQGQDEHLNKILVGKDKRGKGQTSSSVVKDLPSVAESESNYSTTCGDHRKTAVVNRGR